MKHILFFLILFTSVLEAKTLQIMSYNVENLFDTKHDVVNGKDKNDWTLMPKDAPGKKDACKSEKSKYRRQECFDTDWTEEKVEMRINQIHEVLTKERKETPDILGLIEVENAEIVGRLGKKLGYDNVEITESPDVRGVDVALIYKSSPHIKKISRTEHVVPVDYASRNILEVEFLINDNYPLTLFVNHWPSQSNPDTWRVKAAEVLSNRIKEIMGKNPKMHFLAMGDFNVIESNSTNPLKTIMTKDNFLYDVVEDFKTDPKITEDEKKKLNAGTYYYSPKDQWNMLDRFFYSSTLKDGQGMDLVVSSFEIYAPKFIVKELSKTSGTDDEADRKIILAPKKFNADSLDKDKMGYSDHFPIVVSLDYPEVKAAVMPAKVETPKKVKGKKAKK